MTHTLSKQEGIVQREQQPKALIQRRLSDRMFGIFQNSCSFGWHYYPNQLMSMPKSSPKGKNAEQLKVKSFAQGHNSTGIWTHKLSDTISWLWWPHYNKQSYTMKAGISEKKSQLQVWSLILSLGSSLCSCGFPLHSPPKNILAGWLDILATRNLPLDLKGVFTAHAQCSWDSLNIQGDLNQVKVNDSLV